jgi:hypothetical protein
MSNYSQSYIAFSKSLLLSNPKLIQEWASSQDKELSESCKMVLDAGR